MNQATSQMPQVSLAEQKSSMLLGNYLYPCGHVPTRTQVFANWFAIRQQATKTNLNQDRSGATSPV